jgi:hypothetical protein
MSGPIPPEISLLNNLTELYECFIPMLYYFTTESQLMFLTIYLVTIT